MNDCALFVNTLLVFGLNVIFLMIDTVRKLCLVGIGKPCIYSNIHHSLILCGMVL